MKYRAKITHIPYDVFMELVVREYRMVSDETDTYVELSDEEEAIRVESLDSMLASFSKVLNDYFFGIKQ